MNKLGMIKMNNLNLLKELIENIDITGKELNSVKAELRNKEFDLKTRKLNLEFDPEFTKGLKVKEIPHKIHNELLKESQEICELKAKRDELDHELGILKLRFQHLKEVIDSQKQ